MKVLVDECAPKALTRFLTRHGHQCLTVQEAGWSGKQNGALLALAEPAIPSVAANIVNPAEGPQKSSTSVSIATQLTNSPPSVWFGALPGLNPGVGAGLLFDLDFSTFSVKAVFGPFNTGVFDNFLGSSRDGSKLVVGIPEEGVAHPPQNT
jgi:hypothetical protein